MSRHRRPRRISGRRARSGGFTLIEILVAFTILVLFITTTFEVFSSGVRSATRSTEYAKAQTLVRSRLAALAASEPLMPGEESGQVALGTDALILHWRTTLEAYPIPSGKEADPEAPAPVAPLRAVVEVTWGGQGTSAGPHRVVLRALLLGEAQ